MTLMVLDHAAGSWEKPGAGGAGIPLDVLDLRGRDLRGRYGAGLVLVRPDQHVAWRADAVPPDPGAILDRTRGAAAARPHRHCLPGHGNTMMSEELTGRSDL